MIFLAGCIADLGLLAAFAVARIRVVASREGGDRTRRQWSATMDEERIPQDRSSRSESRARTLSSGGEWHRSRPYARLTRFVWSFYGMLVAAILFYQLIMLFGGRGTMRMEISCVLAGGELAIGLLLLAICAPRP